MKKYIQFHTSVAAGFNFNSNTAIASSDKDHNIHFNSFS